MNSRIAIVAVMLLALGDFFIWTHIARAVRPPVLTVSFLDVGQGDAVFIESPTGSQVLIDGGRDAAVLRRLSKEMRWSDRTLDMVIATHPDLDHIGGLPDVLARYKVSYIVHSSVSDDGADNVAFLQSADAEVRDGAVLLEAVRGQQFDLGGEVVLTILAPDRSAPGVDPNMGSIIARLTYGRTSFLLTGDAPQAMEEYLVALDGTSLESTVLKAGHHGSKTSSSPLFVGYVDPEYVVFSRGCDNSYGHPHKEVIELYQRFNVLAADTCIEGTITLTSDGTRAVLED